MAHVSDLEKAARAKGMELPILKMSCESEVDAAFATLGRLGAGALAPPCHGAHRELFLSGLRLAAGEAQ